MKERIDATNAIRFIAKKESITLADARKEIKLAMLAGLYSNDPEVQSRWRKVPCKGKVPTPDELVAYLAANIDANTDPFV